MEEKWKNIEKNPKYEVSSFGRVRRLYPTGYKYLKLQEHKKGYMTVGLGKSGKDFVHRLVGKAFIDNPMNKPQINHKDGVKSNNLWTNLEWSTCMENNDHSFDVLNNGATRVPVVIISRSDLSVVGEYTSRQRAEKELMKAYGSLTGLIISNKSTYESHGAEECLRIAKEARRRRYERHLERTGASGDKRRFKKDDISMIFHMNRGLGMTASDIARSYSVSHTAIASILKGKSYKDMTEGLL